MKKWIVGCVALAGCGWASATWVHAEQAAERYEVSLGAFGLQHGVELVEVGYERDFLSSVARTEVRGGFALSHYAEFMPASWREGSTLVLEHTIQHGPLILDGGFEPLAARVVTTLALDALNDEAAAGLREACGCEEPIKVVSDIKHDGSMAHDWSASGLDWQITEDAAVIDVSLAASQGVVSSSAGGLVEAQGATGAFSVTSEHIDMTVQPLEWTYTGVESEISGLGKLDMVTKGIAIQGANGTVSFKDMRMLNSASVDDGLLRVTGEIGFASVGGPFPLGPSSLSSTVEGVPESAIVEYMSALSVVDFSTVAGREEFLTAYFSLFQPGASMRIGLNSETTTGNAFNMTQTLKYVDVSGPDASDALNTVGDLIKRLDSTLSASVDTALLNDLGLDHMAGMLRQVAVPAGEQYSMNASLSNGDVRLNGQPVHISQMFAQALAQPLPTLNTIASQWLAMEQQ